MFRFGFGVADVNPSDIADVRWLCPCQCSLHGRIPGGHNFYASTKGHVAMLTELRWEFFFFKILVLQKAWNPMDETIDPRFKVSECF